MNYNSLVSDLLALNTRDVASMQSLIKLLTDLSDPSTVQLLSNIRDLENLITNINNLDNTIIIPPDPMTQRERFLNRMERLSKCEKESIAPKSTSSPPTAPEPYFQRFDIVHCQFGGVGWEYDGPHYAMVWEDNPSESEITIIPTTSQYTVEKETEFSVGYISGLPPSKRTILSVHKTMMISRKRVDFSPVRNAYVLGRIPLGQQPWVQNRVDWALAFWMYKEKSLSYYVRNETQECLPIDFTTGFANYRFLPVRDVKWDRANLKLQYRIYNEPGITTLDFLRSKPGIFVKRSHKLHSIYDPFFSENVVAHTGAIAEFVRCY